MAQSWTHPYAEWRVEQPKKRSNPLKPLVSCWQVWRRGVNFKKAQKLFVSLDGSDDVRRMTFTFAIIALAAKVARVDGQPKREEFMTFRDVFPMPGGEDEKIRNLYEMAAKDVSGVLHHARQIAGAFPGHSHRAFRASVMRGLIKIGLTDGALSDGEETLLRQIAKEFEISRWQFNRLVKAGGEPPLDTDPYYTLGVDRSWTDAKIKQSYYKKVRENHPDAVMARGGDNDSLEIAQRRIATLNAAYGAIRKERSCVVA